MYCAAGTQEVVGLTVTNLEVVQGNDLIENSQYDLRLLSCSFLHVSWSPAILSPQGTR
jgi:hypothetical protein